jgi:hypothetical protein
MAIRRPLLSQLKLVVTIKKWDKLQSDWPITYSLSVRRFWYALSCKGTFSWLPHATSVLGRSSDSADALTRRLAQLQLPKYTTISDSGSHFNAVAEESCNKATAQRLVSLEVPLRNCVLISTCGTRTRRLKKQATFAVSINDNAFEKVLMISSH